MCSRSRKTSGFATSARSLATPATTVIAWPILSSRALTLDSRLSVNESWLLWLRWVAVAGQLTTIGAAVAVFDVSVRLRPLLIIISVTALTNLLFAWWLRAQGKQADTDRQRHQYVLGSLMVLDLFSLSGLLYFTGGPTNPFTVFYFVNLALAAVVLPAHWGWTLLLIAVVCLALLFAGHHPLPELDRPLRGGGITLGQFGFAAALTGCAAVVTYFITRVTRELRHREKELRIAEQQRARSERLESLATLAAGAGHELASPLSTIAVIAKDLTQHLQGAQVPQSVIEDVGLIRSELDICRNILDQLASRAGHASGEILQSVSVTELVEQIVFGIRRQNRVQVTVDAETAQRQIVVPVVGVAQAIRGVVRNALDAVDSRSAVTLNISGEQNRIRFVIEDRGVGMSADVLGRAVEPFFTTKEAGQGMGLGLFLARNVVARLGGTLDIESVPGQGTTVVIELPACDPR